MGDGSWDGPYETIQCKRALSPSKLPGLDYALNPYGGCAHGCVYCYAPEVTHSPWEGWRVVRVKTNIARRLWSETASVRGVVGIGTVTDPYQYAESRFMLTRQCLGVLKERGMRVHIHTKSDLIVRDSDIIADIGGTVGFTVTNVSDKSSKITEPGAPLPAQRFDAMRSLVSAGIDVYALVGPVLDTLSGNESEFVDSIVETGVRTVYLDRLNLRPELSARLSKMHISGSPKALERIRSEAESRGLKVFDVFENRRRDI